MFADGVKEKRWVEFKGEVDSTSIPVEWICWLNGQRKVAPSPEEMAMLEARRQRVKENVALLKKEEEERKAREGSSRKITTMGKGDGPDLKSFIQQLPVASEGDKSGEASEATSNKQKEKEVADQAKHEPESTEPTGSGASFRPGTWQPPS
ncbi:NADH:ubiquinone oxidoreductase, 17.2kDa subunit [Artemisia annua]|uniref:NADH dehydrogenase [ubiquinone] 1 alpha subcomplex subunit 12 n=1 Tax=Artemisia annua TaxID=35608 RepID=A0A2U1PM87_ARTAN|nr:NADH:ubiquinone oxidoreductase, 17.2kDa subunit [Artemisia annua]